MVDRYRRVVGHQQVSQQQVGDRDVAALRTVARNRGIARDRHLMEAVQQLDVQPDAAALHALMSWIHERYDERQGGQLVGLFSRCYLGEPYVDHRLDIAGRICEHFSRADVVPMPFAAARPLAASQAYLFIEIYSDGAVVPIRPDGRAVA